MTTQTPESKSKSSAGKALAAVALSAVLAVLLAEIAVRLVLPHPAFYRGHPGNVPGLVVAHPVRGYTWTSGFEGRMTTADFSNAYVISEDGLRDVPLGAGAARTILAVGDSFTGGEGVEAEQTWPKQLENILNDSATPAERVRVVNAGVTGYGATQMRQMAEELVPRLAPDLVAIAVYPRAVDRIANPFVLYGEHLVRSRATEDMRLVDGGFLWFQSSFYNRRAAALDIWSQHYWHFAAHLLKAVQTYRLGRHESEQAAAAKSTPEPAVTQSDAVAHLQPLLDELSALRAYLDYAGPDMLVLIVSGQESDGSFSAATRAMANAVLEYCNRNDIPAVSPLAAFEEIAGGEPVLRFKNDGHWTPQGHRQAAAELARVAADRPAAD